MFTAMQQRRDTAANWTANNPVLLAGQIGVETDTVQAKVGDGATSWNSLPYFVSATSVSSVFGRTGRVTAQTGDYTAAQVGALPVTGGTVTGNFTAQGGFNTGVQTFTTNGSIDGHESTVFMNAANLTLNLPSAVSTTGKIITIKLIYPFTTGTISAVGGQMIDGYPSYQLTTQYQWVTVQSNGANWLVVGAKPGGLLGITVTSLPDGTANQSYSVQLTATGGWPGYTWSVKSGVLPAGLSLSATGLLSGTPTVAAPGGFTVQVTDSVGTTATASLSLTICGGFVLVQQGAVVNASNGSNAAPLYTQTTASTNLLIAHIGANGTGPITTTSPGWTVVTGISQGGNGNYAVAYKLNSSVNETPPTFSRSSTSDMWAYLEEWSGGSTTAPPDLIAVSSASAPNWTVTFASLASTAAELNVVTGYWNGSNTGGKVSLSSFTNSINQQIHGNFLYGANAFGQYFAGISGVSGPTGSTLQSVSMSLSVFAGGDGIMVSFKPANAGTPPPPTITTTSPLPSGSTQQPYSTTLSAENGEPPYTWSLQSGTLPTGLTLSSAGVISGTPTVAVSSTPLLIKVTDSVNQTGTSTLNLTIAQTPTVTFTTTLPQGTSQNYTVSSIVGTTTGVNVNNNVWNPVTGWSSTLSVVDPTDWWVIANFPQGNTAVSSYPSLDCVFSDLPLSSFSSITSSFSEQMNSNPGTQAWAAYDIWCNNWANEIMIHHDLARFNPYDNTPVASGITFGGSGGIPALSWDLRLYGAAEYVWQPANNSFNIQSGSVNILQMLQWMITNGFLPATNTLTAIGYGWEICSTGGQNEFFKINSFGLTALYG